MVIIHLRCRLFAEVNNGEDGGITLLIEARLLGSY